MRIVRHCPYFLIDYHQAPLLSRKVKSALGFHWYHFDMPVLPPIAPAERNNAAIDQKLIIVYLPIETPAKIEQFLPPFKHQYFAVYHPNVPSSKNSNIQWHKPSKARFHADLSQWLETGRGVSVRYPEVAGAVAQWLTEGNYSSQSIETLSARLWRHSRLPQQALFSAAEIDSMVNSVVAQVYVLLVT